MKYHKENKLLLRVVQCKFDTKNINYIQQLFEKELNWEYILTHSKSLTISSLFFHNLKKMGLENLIPVHIQQEFKKIYFGMGYRNAMFYVVLKEVLSSFQESGINTIVLKGAALAEIVWDNIALREMQDIDLLIKEADIDKAREAILELGYIFLTTTPLENWDGTQAKHLPPAVNQKNGIPVEVHHNILYPQNPFQVDLVGAWARARVVKIAGIKTLIFHPEDLLIHLSLHYSRGYPAFKKIRDLVDISQTISFYKDQFDWDFILQEASERGFINYIYCSLYLSKVTLNSEIDTDILDKFKEKSSINPVKAFFLTVTVKRFFRYTDTQPVIPNWLFRFISEALVRPIPLSAKISFLSSAIYSHISEGQQVSALSLGMFPWILLTKTWRHLFRGVPKFIKTII